MPPSQLSQTSPGAVGINELKDVRKHCQPLIWISSVKWRYRLSPRESRARVRCSTELLLSCLPPWSHLLCHGRLHSLTKDTYCCFLPPALSWPYLTYSCRPLNLNSACLKSERAQRKPECDSRLPYQFLLRISWPQWDPCPGKPHGAFPLFV